VYLLDTDVAIYLLNGRLPQVKARLREVPAGQVGTTAVTAAELRYGALRSGRPERNLARAESFLRPLRVVAFDDQAAIHFARVKEHLVRRGKLIGAPDLFIAACTLAVGGTLVTNNVREFARVPGLLWENWAEAAGSEEPR
jgi:tRNA(fMet)-specific endonuclease VapC